MKTLITIVIIFLVSCLDNAIAAENIKNIATLRFTGGYIYPQPIIESPKVIDLENLKFTGINIDIDLVAAHTQSDMLVGKWNCPLGHGINWDMQFFQKGNYKWKQNIPNDYYMIWEGRYYLTTLSDNLYILSNIIDSLDSNLSDVGILHVKTGDKSDGIFKQTDSKTLEFYGVNMKCVKID